MYVQVTFAHFGRWACMYAQKHSNTYARRYIHTLIYNTRVYTQKHFNTYARRYIHTLIYNTRVYTQKHFNTHARRYIHTLIPIHKSIPIHTHVDTYMQSYNTGLWHLWWSRMTLQIRLLCFWLVRIQLGKRKCSWLLQEVCMYAVVYVCKYLCIVLYCIVLYCIVLYAVIYMWTFMCVLYCSVLYCIVLYSILRKMLYICVDLYLCIYTLRRRLKDVHILIYIYIYIHTYIHTYIHMCTMCICALTCGCSLYVHMFVSLHV